MTIIRTSRNRVIADEPDENDVMVVVGWTCPTDDPRYRRRLATEPVPIDAYPRTLDWAVSMADQIEGPLHVLPLTAAQAFSPERLARLERAVAALTDEERGQLRREAITACAEVMRDADDSALRREAFDVLVTMGVVAA